MSAPSLTGWKNKIREYCDANGIDKSDSQVSRMATKICKRMAAMNEEIDFYTALRILGMSSDTTARDAIRNMERAA